MEIHLCIKKKIKLKKNKSGIRKTEYCFLSSAYKNFTRMSQITVSIKTVTAISNIKILYFK